MEGEGDGEVRSMTSRGFVHSSLGMADTPAHVHVGLGLGFTGTHGAPSRLPQSSFLLQNSSHSFCSAALVAFVVGLSVSRAPVVAPLTEVVDAVPVEVSRFLALRAVSADGGGQRIRGRGVAFRVWLIGGALAPCSVEKTGARGKGGERATRGLNWCMNHT